MPILKLAIAVVTMAFVNSGISNPGFARTSAYSTKAPNWGGKAGNLKVIMTFEQGADSVYARGAYQVTTGKRIGCGGETLPASGLFTMRAQGTMRSFRGRFLFDAGWSPPITGTRSATGKMTVNIRSVDRGVCPLILRPTTERNPGLRH